MPQAVLDWGVEFVRAVQAMGAWLIAPMNFFTFLGQEEFFLLILPLLYLSINSRLAIRVTVFLFISVWINWILKTLIHDPRPYWVDSGIRLLAPWENNFGIPSGHAQNAVVLWGGLAAAFQRKWVWFAAVLLMFFIGFSRIFLAAHYPTDVLAGWLAGIVLLWLLLEAEPAITARFGRLSTQRKIAALFTFSLLAILISVVLSLWLEATWEIPADWARRAIENVPGIEFRPHSFVGVITTMGAFFGLTAGAVWLDLQGGYQASGPILNRVIRFVAGIIVAIVIWAGLDALFSLLAPDESLSGYVLRFIRYGLVGFWIAYLSPRLFIRLGLAETEAAASH